MADWLERDEWWGGPWAGGERQRDVTFHENISMIHTKKGKAQNTV